MNLIKLICQMVKLIDEELKILHIIKKSILKNAVKFRFPFR